MRPIVKRGLWGTLSVGIGVLFGVLMGGAIAEIVMGAIAFGIEGMLISEGIDILRDGLHENPPSYEEATRGDDLPSYEEANEMHSYNNEREADRTLNNEEATRYVLPSYEEVNEIRQANNEREENRNNRGSVEHVEISRDGRSRE